jgi:hypothetical protein
MTVQVVTEETVTIRYAALLARAPMRELAATAKRYPGSYSRERVMEEANRFLDAALDHAVAAVAANPPRTSCVVCDGLGCEYCPGVTS